MVYSQLPQQRQYLRLLSPTLVHFAHSQEMLLSKLKSNLRHQSLLLALFCFTYLQFFTSAVHSGSSQGLVNKQPQHQVWQCHSRPHQSPCTVYHSSNHHYNHVSLCIFLSQSLYSFWLHFTQFQAYAASSIILVFSYFIKIIL